MTSYKWVSADRVYIHRRVNQIADTGPEVTFEDPGPKKAKANDLEGKTSVCRQFDDRDGTSDVTSNLMTN